MDMSVLLLCHPCDPPGACAGPIDSDVYSNSEALLGQEGATTKDPIRQCQAAAKTIKAILN